MVTGRKLTYRRNGNREFTREMIKAGEMKEDVIG